MTLRWTPEELADYQARRQRSAADPPPPPPMTEATLQAAVLDLARRLGWRTYHTRDSRGSAAGYPDLTLVRGDRLVFAELKAATGRTTPEQDAWLEELAATAAEVHLWTPDDYPDRIQVALR